MKTLLSKRVVWVALLVMLQGVFLSSCNSQKKSEVPYAKSFLVDVRTPEEFSEGTVNGAVNIPLNEIESRFEEFKGKEQIVVFCRSGSRSTEAKRILESNGFTNIVNGGTWQNVKNEVEKE